MSWRNLRMSMRDLIKKTLNRLKKRKGNNYFN